MPGRSCNIYFSVEDHEALQALMSETSSSASDIVRVGLRLQVEDRPGLKASLRREELLRLDAQRKALKSEIRRLDYASKVRGEPCQVETDVSSTSMKPPLPRSVGLISRSEDEPSFRRLLSHLRDKHLDMTEEARCKFERQLVLLGSTHPPWVDALDSESRQWYASIQRSVEQRNGRITAETAE